MDLGLKNTSVIITGSSRGIGRAIAEAFLAEGARVVITGREQGAVTRTVAALGKEYPKSNILPFIGDLARADQFDLCSALVLKKWKKLNVLVTNIGSGKIDPHADPKQERQRMRTINYDSAVMCIKKAVPLLQKAKGPRSIISVASIAGVTDIGAPKPYAEAKAALIEYCLLQSVPLAKEGIRLNVVSPGNIKFPGGRWEELEKADPSRIRTLLDEKVPAKRFGTPHEIADMVVFLASPRSAFTIGSNVIIDGGQLAALKKE